MLCVLCLLSREAQGAEEVMNCGAASLSSRHSSTTELPLYKQSDAVTKEGQLIVKEISDPTVSGSLRSQSSELSKLES